MSSGLICAYITCIHDKKLSRHAPHDIYCKQSEFLVYYLLISVIIYATDNLELTLTYKKSDFKAVIAVVGAVKICMC